MRLARRLGVVLLLLLTLLHSSHGRIERKSPMKTNLPFPSLTEKFGTIEYAPVQEKIDLS